MAEASRYDPTTDELSDEVADVLIEVSPASDRLATHIHVQERGGTVQRSSG